jgi:hypothetical protein
MYATEETPRRMQAAGLAVDHQCESPLTQIEIGDALGLARRVSTRSLLLHEAVAASN